MWRVINVTDGAIEEVGITDTGFFPGSILAIEAELYEVLHAEGSDDDGCVS